MNKQKILVASLIGLMLMPMAAFAHEGHNQAFGGNAVATSELPKITVDPAGQRAIGLKTQVVTTGSVNQILTATGQVQAAENRAYDVNPRVSGTVSRIYVQQGDTVRSGQTLATIHSVEVANVLTRLLEDRARLQSEITQARTQYQGDIAVQANEVELARANYQREQALLNEGITARKDYQAAKNTYESAQVRLNTLKQRSAQEVALKQRQLSLTISAVKSQLRVMGLSDASVNQALANNRVVSEIPITAPVSGKVTFRDVSLGETIEPGKRIFSIVNLSPIWVVVNVFQEQIARIQTGQSVRIKTPTNTIVQGSISNVGTVVDPENRTLPVRIISNNSGELLKPGMFVSAEIVTGKSAANRMVAPASAVVDEGGRSVVYVKNGNDFQAIPVQIGQRASDQVEILDGIYEGDEIVIQGAKQLRAQSLIASSGAGEEGHTDKAPTNEMPTLLLGILIGAGLMLAGGAGWLLFKKRPVHLKGRR